MNASRDRARGADLGVLQTALRGDAPAMRQLVELLAPVIQARVARALLRRSESHGRDIGQEVADLTQEVFAGLFADEAKALRAWEPELGLSLANFVGLLAERRVASVMRSKHRAPWTEQATGAVEDAGDGVTSHETQVMSRLMLAQLLDVLRETLSTRGLELFYRLYVDEETVEQVCDATGLHPSAVYQWKSRLGQAARTALAKLQAEASQSVHAHEPGIGRSR